MVFEWSFFTNHMKKEYRIKKSSEIDAIFVNKVSKGDKYFAIYTQLCDEDVHFRFALSVGKKYGNAVQRNLIKRRIRHIVQMFKDQIVCMRFVIVIKPQARELTFQQIKEKMQDILQKLNLLETKHEKS